MTNEKQINLSELAKRIRQHCVRMTGKANASHIGGALSAADLLACIYGRALRYRPQRPDWPDRDRFIMSKVHACSALYAARSDIGYFPVERLQSLDQPVSPSSAHVKDQNVPADAHSTGI